MEYSAQRRARKADAVPNWYGELDSFVVAESYGLAEIRRNQFDLPWEVDHIIPLSGKKVCGLHCARNIQVIPMTLNRRKSNRPVLQQEFEWISFL